MMPKMQFFEKVNLMPRNASRRKSQSLLGLPWSVPNMEVVVLKYDIEVGPKILCDTVDDYYGCEFSRSLKIS